MCAQKKALCIAFYPSCLAIPNWPGGDEIRGYYGDAFLFSEVEKTGPESPEENAKR
jgi:hypothetical protein